MDGTVLSLVHTLKVGGA